MLEHFANDPDMENGMVDSTIVRAHARAAGATKMVGRLNRRWGVVAAGSVLPFADVLSMLGERLEVLHVL